MAKGAGATVTPAMRGGGKGGGRASRGGTVGFTGMSPKQFSQYVNAQVRGMYGPEVNQLNKYDSGMDNMFKTETGETNLGSTELAQMLAQIAPAIKANYTDAANADAGYTKGLTDNLGAVAPGVDPGVGSVLDTEFGLIPGQTLQQQGAGFEAAGQLLPQTALGMRNAATDAISGDQSKFDLGAQSKLATLLGEEGKARETIANDVQNQAYKGFEGKLAAGRLGLEQQKFVTDTRLSQARLNLESQRFAQSIFQQNRQYSLSLSRLGIENKRLQLSVAKSAYSMANGGYTQAEISRYELKANSMANSAFHGTTVYRSKTVNGVSTEVPVHEGGISYNQALGQLMKDGIPVQIALKSLDHVYPAQYRPSPEQLKQILGGLTPESINQAIQQQHGQQQAGNDVAGSLFSGPVSARGATNPQGAKNAAFRMAASYGWGDRNNLVALEQLWTRESGWSYTAKNKSSGALGIPQALGHKLPPGYANNPLIQIKWGLNYIKGRYGSPAAAWQHEMQFGWY